MTSFVMENLNRILSHFAMENDYYSLTRISMHFINEDGFRNKTFLMVIDNVLLTIRANIRNHNSLGSVLQSRDFSEGPIFLFGKERTIVLGCLGLNIWLFLPTFAIKSDIELETYLIYSNVLFQNSKPKPIYHNVDGLISHWELRPYDCIRYTVYSIWVGLICMCLKYSLIQD